MRKPNYSKILPNLMQGLIVSGSLLTFSLNSYAVNKHIEDPMSLSNDTQWYEVNIVIFKHDEPGFQNEQWRDRDQLNLQFPYRTAMLDDDSYDQIDHSKIELEPYIANTYAPEPPPIPQPSLKIHDGNAEGGVNNTVEDDLGITLAPQITAFRSINTEDEEFRQALRRLRNSKAYKIMLTKTWRQPGLAPEKSIPVLIQAGDEYDGNYELEGTVNVSLSRYLHVQSNLWLSEYVKQIELSTSWWEQSSYEDAPSLDGEPNNNYDGSSLLSDSTLNPPTDAIPNPEGTLSETGNPLLSSLSINETTAHYEAIRTVVLDESRRMRSNEFHYLDHPLFGMIIKVTPYEAPATDFESTTPPPPAPLPSGNTP